MLKESDIITQLQQAFPGPCEHYRGIGDDAAIIPFDKERVYVISKDLLVEDVHFRLRYFSPQDLAHKSLHVNLSDLAAMGATPKYVLMGIAISPTLDATWLKDFLTHFSHMCQQEKVVLIGGDTVASLNGVTISLTIIGEAHSSQVKYRHQAKPGDDICIVGELGLAYTGLIALEKGIPDLLQAKKYSLQPLAKTKEGLWLSTYNQVHAMMDISDGLWVDLKRLCAASHCGADILLEQCIPSKDLITAATSLQLDPLECMVSGGEDYALLLTMAPNTFDPLNDAFKQHFGYPMTRIGVVTQNTAVVLKKNGQPYSLSTHPFSHFGEE